MARTRSETGATGLFQVAAGVFVHAAGTNVGILKHGKSALLFNAGNPVVAAALRQAGVETVSRVFFTHHRRELADGLDGVCREFSPRLVVPAGETHLFAAPDRYWTDPKARWLVLCNHVPYHVTHHHRIMPDATATDGEVVLRWHGWTIRALLTPGYTDGSVSYLATKGDRRIVFCGDLIFGPGRIRDLYCLQHADERHGRRIGDYHGFMGSMETVVSSLDSLLKAAPTLLVPAHGTVMDRPEDAAQLLIARLRAVFYNYMSVSALRWYVPEYFGALGAGDDALPQQECFPLPRNVRRVRGNVWLLVAENGHALMTDPYAVEAVDEVQKLLDSGEIAGIDGIWLTHYHCDHVQEAAYARANFGCPVITDRMMADIVARPGAYYLTCLANTPCVVDRKTTEGEIWRWANFTLTAYHFPGQTYYHAGLAVVSDAGERYFFAGDSFTPTGIDDYCCWNRNFLGRDVGFERCIGILRAFRPDIVFNQHVEVGFRFTEAAFDCILANLARREALLAELLPWEHPNFGTDEYWVHTYPYEQAAAAGTEIGLDVRVFNHAADAREARVSVVGPEGWAVCPAVIEKICRRRAETRFRFAVQVPSGATPGRWIVPVRIHFAGLDLGTFREGIVIVG